VVWLRAASRIQARWDAALKPGATPCVDTAKFASHLPANFLAPQVYTQVDHDMALMTEETFGPIVGVMPVSKEARALALMNDSEYGLTASVWTADLDWADRFSQQLQVGTVLANRCDYLDPALVWTGVKNTGRGASLSPLGYHALTQPKSFYFRDLQ